MNVLIDLTVYFCLGTDKNEHGSLSWIVSVILGFVGGVKHLIKMHISLLYYSLDVGNKFIVLKTNHLKSDPLSSLYLSMN